MRRLQSWSATTVLLATMMFDDVWTPLQGALYAGETAASAATLRTGRQARNSRPLANGVYAVVRERPATVQVQPPKGRQVVLVYDRKYSDADKDQPPLHVTLDALSFVPLILAGPPNSETDEGGRTLLDVTLAPQHVKTLEDFTRTHLGRRIAIVIDGEIITMHKVRSVIKDGKARITRCADDACRSLFLKLTR